MGSVLTTYPTDSSSPVFSIICSQDFKEDVGVSAIVSELQETGEATHSKLQEQDRRGEMFIFDYWFILLLLLFGKINH